mgnify:FL=1|tara:strand:+ start:1180 stop:1791 length:612 start_codon:yes stop_codon:yes gene_type:complete
MPELTSEEQSALKVLTGDDKTPARISYAKIFTPETNDLSGKDEYSCMVLIPKSDTKTVNAVKTAIKLAIKGKFGDKRPTGLRIPLRDGDKAGDGGVPSGAQPGTSPYGDHYFVNAKNTRQPGVVDEKRRPIIESGQIVSGDYVRVSINAFGYDNKSKGVAFGLNAVQLVRKGEPLGNSFDAANEFTDLPEQGAAKETDDSMFD